MNLATSALRLRSLASVLVPACTAQLLCTIGNFNFIAEIQEIIVRKTFIDLFMTAKNKKCLNFCKQSISLDLFLCSI